MLTWHIKCVCPAVTHQAECGYFIHGFLITSSFYATAALDAVTYTVLRTKRFVNNRRVEQSAICSVWQRPVAEHIRAVTEVSHFGIRTLSGCAVAFLRLSYIYKCHYMLTFASFCLVSIFSNQHAHHLQCWGEVVCFTTNMWRTYPGWNWKSDCWLITSANSNSHFLCTTTVCMHTLMHSYQ